MKKLMAIAALAATFANAATDCGVIVTDKNIDDYAKVESGSGGTATVTIVNGSGTANSVTVYNKSTLDTALAGKASTGDVSALQGRATALETATNNISTALATHTAARNNPHGVTCAQIGAVEAVNGEATQLTLNTGDEDNIALALATSGAGLQFLYQNGFWHMEQAAGALAIPKASGTLTVTSDIPTSWPYTAITNAPWIVTESDPTIYAWAKAASKPSYNFSEIGSRPTTISGYGITDAKIAGGTITLGGSTITPVVTESDPTALKPSQLRVNGTAMTTASAAVELGGYYIAVVDGKPHLMLR